MRNKLKQHLLLGFDKARKSSLFLSEDAFALPSILFLITILSLLALSVLALEYFQKELALRDVACVKSAFASESGIAQSLARIINQDSLSHLGPFFEQSFVEEDGSESHITVKPWGLFLLTQSVGKYHTSVTRKTAVIAQLPGVGFDKAIILANPSDQLVFTGTSAVIGDIVVGQPGVTIGTLRNYTSPLNIPVKGSIDRKQNPELPEFNSYQIKKEIETYLALLSEGNNDSQDSGHYLYFPSNETVVLQTQIIPDRIDHVVVQGGVIIHAQLFRGEKPLYVVAHGDVKIQKGSELKGLVAVISSENISIEEGAMVDQAVLFSKKSIEMQAGATVTCQLLAPSVNVQKNAVARYPSVIFSSTLGDSGKQLIFIADEARVEGMVILISSTSLPLSTDKLLVINPHAKIIGGVYSNARVTLDGTVIGSVMTDDFYFCETPTTYLGWVRSGLIDRGSLPKGFLTPPGFGDEIKLAILDWL